MAESVWFNIHYVDGVVDGTKAIFTSRAESVYKTAHEMANKTGAPVLLVCKALNIERTVFPDGAMEVVNPQN